MLGCCACWKLPAMAARFCGNCMKREVGKTGCFYRLEKEPVDGSAMIGTISLSEKKFQTLVSKLN